MSAWGLQGRRWATLGALCFASFVLLSIIFLDRPISSWMAFNLHQDRAWFDLPTHLVDPLLPLASIGLLVSAVLRAAGSRLGAVGRSLVLACFAVAIAVLLKEQAKFLFGRLWPETWVDRNPSWIGNGTYGFFPFHGGRGWASFPSGHMTVVTAPAAVLWQTLPRLRPFLSAMCLAVAVGLLGADYHFFSDIVAGTALGAGCGYAVVAVMAESEGQPSRSELSPGGQAPSQILAE